MTKAELESKHLSDLHSLAADAGVERYRMLSRAELIEKLSDGGGASPAKGSGSGSQSRERPPRRRRRSGSGGGERGERGERAERPQRRERPERRERKPAAEKPARPEPEPAPEPPSAPAQSSGAAETPSRPRRRRRRRFGRRGKDEVSIQSLLLPAAGGRQAILCAESREGCTALLRGVAHDLSEGSKGPDPVVLLIDPSPEELADWKREAPQAEIVAAGQARHASDALAQAANRAGSGEDVILLIDSLSRFASAYGDVEAAKELFDAGRVQGSAGGGSLTVVAALERPA